MKKNFLIIIGLTGIALGAGLFGIDYFADQKAQEKCETQLSQGTGLNVTCAKADVNFLNQNVTIENIQFSNVKSFSSSFLFKIGTVSLKPKSLIQQPLEIESLVLEDLEISLDLSSNINPLKPNDILRINLEEFLDQNRKKEQKEGVEIGIITLNKIQFRLNLKLPFKPEAITHEFTIEQVQLTDVTTEELPSALLSAVQEQIFAEIKLILSQQSLPQVEMMLKQLQDLIDSGRIKLESSE